MSLIWYAILCGFGSDVLFTIDLLWKISCFCQNAHHDWLTKEYWFLVRFCPVPSWHHILLGIIFFVVSFSLGIGFLRVQDFNFSTCTWRTRFCPVPSWHHLLLYVKLLFPFHKVLDFLRGTYTLQFPFIVYI